MCAWPVACMWGSGVLLGKEEIACIGGRRITFTVEEVKPVALAGHDGGAVPGHHGSGQEGAGRPLEAHPLERAIGQLRDHRRL